MPDSYLALKWLHVASACIGFGSNVTHIFWLMAAGHDARHRVAILSLVKRIDDRLAVPAWIVTIGCGVTMWWLRWPGNASWVISSLALSSLLAAMGIAYGPVMKNWIRLAGACPAEPERLASMGLRMTAWWAAISLGVLAVLWLMISKPSLW